MRLGRKLQIAYLSLLVLPAMIAGMLILVSYYTTPTSLGPLPELKAPAWIKPELAAILEGDEATYHSLRERVVLFVVDNRGSVLYPEGSPEIPSLIGRFGDDQSVGLTVTSYQWQEDSGLVGWRDPVHGLPGFFVRRRWMMPLIFLVGLFFIPAVLDARLRRSVGRLTSAAGRISEGRLDDPVIVEKKDELNEVARALEEARTQLKEARDRKSRVLMALSHDLRTPLTSIKGYLEAIQDGLAPKKADRERYLGIIREKSELLETRVGELIDFARSDTAGWRRYGHLVDVASLFERLDTAFKQDAGFAGRRYESQCRLAGDEVLNGDADSLYRALENLFENALRYSGKNDVVRFGMASSTERITVTMADGGPGVPEEFVPSLFEPFSRADRSRNRSGMGLGLASVAAVAEAHGGSVAYSRAPDGGAVFTVELPLETHGG